MKAILLSGGMDSSSLAFLLKPQVAVFINYGQRCSRAEETAAQLVCSTLGTELLQVDIDHSALGVGLLAGKSQADSNHSPEWWPYRNQMLITLAAMRLYGRGVQELHCGAVHGDGQRHRDGAREFFNLLSAVLEFQEGGLRLSAPAAEVSTSMLVRNSKIPVEILAATHSCHVSDFACGQCPGCWKRERVLNELGLVQI